jgi:hypothetical protein
MTQRRPKNNRPYNKSDQKPKQNKKRNKISINRQHRRPDKMRQKPTKKKFEKIQIEINTESHHYITQTSNHAQQDKLNEKHQFTLALLRPLHTVPRPRLRQWY